MTDRASEIRWAIRGWYEGQRASGYCVKLPELEFTNLGVAIDNMLTAQELGERRHG